jgi:hypothetical protein
MTEKITLFHILDKDLNSVYMEITDRGKKTFNFLTVADIVNVRKELD